LEAGRSFQRHLETAFPHLYSVTLPRQYSIAPIDVPNLQMMPQNSPLSVIQPENATPILLITTPERTQATGKALQKFSSRRRAAQGEGERNDGFANLRAASALANSQENASPSNADTSSQLSSWSRFWSGKSETLSAWNFKEPTAVPVFRSHLKTIGKVAAFPALISLIPIPAFAAVSAARPATEALFLKPYLMAAAFLAATYGTHRAISWTIDKLAFAFNWRPHTTDTVRFVSSTTNWLLGLGLILHSAGVSGNVLFTTGGVALGLAINKTLANLMRAVLFVANRPFNIGENLRIGNKIYEVTDLEPKYATLKFLEIASEAVSTTDSDPEYSYFTYSQLADKALNLYRPYTGIKGKISFKPLFNFGVGPLMGALKELPKYSYLKVMLWALGLFVFGGVLPILKAHAMYHSIGVALPYAQSIFALLVSNAAAQFFEKFIPLIGKYSKWNAQTMTLFRLTLQLTAYLIGISLAIGALGINIGNLAVGLGVGAVAFTLASSNILGNIAQAVSLRWQSPFKVGDTIEIAGEKGEVAEIGLFYIVIKTGENKHALIPYSLLESSELIVYNATSTPKSL
jgi:small-conductance mechanosensitive channel